MNGKKAKKLRKLAQQLTIGKPDVYYENMVTGMAITPTGGLKPFSNPPTIALGYCTRKVYKRLKKAHG